MVDKPVLTRIWADGAAPADVVDPDVTTPGKFDLGWESEIPPYEHFNFLQNLFTKGFAHINERGVVEWDPDTNYSANISYVTSPVDGLIYRAKTDNSGNEPSASPTQWGVYPPPTPSATVSIEGLVELATNSETQAGSDTSRAVTPSGLASLTATTSRRGLSEIATQTEVNTGTDTTRYVTPDTLNGKTATTSRRGVVELATDAETQAGSDGSRAVTPNSLASLTATESRRGLIEIASSSEVAAGSTDTRAVTPQGLLARTATSSRTGLVELATNSETQAGSDTSRAVTPAGLASVIDGLGLDSATTADSLNVNGSSEDGYIIFDGIKNPSNPGQRLCLQWVRSPFTNNNSTYTLTWPITSFTVLTAPMVGTHNTSSGPNSGNSGWRTNSWSSSGITLSHVPTGTGTLTAGVAWACGWVTPP